MIVEQTKLIQDYCLTHPDVEYAKQLESHLDMFDIFKIQNDQMIILCYSAAITLVTSGME